MSPRVRCVCGVCGERGYGSRPVKHGKDCPTLKPDWRPGPPPPGGAGVHKKPWWKR